jgi:hypothetical protein
MRTGSIYDVVEVLKSDVPSQVQASIPRRMLDRAKFLVVSRSRKSWVRRWPSREQVEAALERCFATKTKNTIVKPKTMDPASAARAPKAVAAAVAPAPKVASKVATKRNARAS